MRMLHALALYAGLGSLVVLVGCGGQSPASPQVAPGLKYANPTAPGYRLVQNPESTPQRLVLDLMGPVGEKIQGISLALSTEGQKAVWGSIVQEGGALDLGTGQKLLMAKTNRGDLEVGLFQKGRAAALLGSQPIARFSLTLQPGAAKGVVALSAAQAQVLDGDGKTVPVQVATGVLSVE